MISWKFRFIFVHIPKTGGTSIEHALRGRTDYIPHSQDHCTIHQIQRFAMPDELFDAYFKFSFVRNPWDRAVSWYKNVIEEQCHRAEYGVAPDCTFRDFLTLHGDNYGLQSQLCWLRDRNGSVPLDFIGRFERLQKDFEYVCQQLSMPPTILEPGHARSQNRTPYTAFYDNFTRDLVRRRYAEEIEMFGYTFETA